MNTKSLLLGPLIINIEGTSLTPEDRQRLTHPLVGGIILFTRNYVNYAQLKQLIQDIHQLRSPRLLVSVDHEGGRVQRWLAGFTQIPPMGTLGQLYAKNPGQALARAFSYGRISALELGQLGVDLNFAPVLDIDYGSSQVLNGARAFHQDPTLVTRLARAYINGLRSGGMQAVGKHFPGHGGVVADSHFALPRDNRTFAQLRADIFPFQQLIRERLLGGVMTAHIIYASVNPQVATLSTFWMQTLLRQRLGFRGAIISDDISMRALENRGNYPQRVRLALRAGCDLILLCNNLPAVDQVLGCMDAWTHTTSIIDKLYLRPF